MARRSGGTHKGVEEKRRSLPIYQHYTLSPGKTKSHHPEAKCNHCLKEFVCGSKQRLIRHLRKCNSITNPEQIIAETLNTLARNSATGQLNHSILEASNLLPSQINHQLHQQQHQHYHHPHHQLVVGQPTHHHHSAVSNNGSNNSPSTNSTINNNNISNHNISNSTNNTSNHNTSGSSNDTGLIASSSNGAPISASPAATGAAGAPGSAIKRPQRRGRKPANQLGQLGSSIHVTTGLDGKTHFTPTSQLTQPVTGAITSPTIIAQAHNGRAHLGYSYHPATVSNTATPLTTTGAHISNNSGHLTPNHHSVVAGSAVTYKLNPDPIDRAYLKLVLTRNLPLSLCDTKEFQFWVKTFANDYKPPSSINLITQNLKNEAQVAKQRVANILVKAPKKTINLELHNWHDQQRGHSWFAIIANIDLKRFLISVKDIYSTNYTNHSSQQQQQQQQHQPILNDDYHDTVDKMLSNFIDECIKRIGSDRVNSLMFSRSRLENLSLVRAQQTLYTTHPSIVTYFCWWNFTNLLCSDIIEHSEAFRNLVRESKRLINFINSRPKLANSLEKFNPFGEVSGSLSHKKNDTRWYSHLVCYLFEYIKNNHETITVTLDGSLRQSHFSTSDNNNNSSTRTSDHSNTTTTSISTSTTTSSSSASTISTATNVNSNNNNNNNINDNSNNNNNDAQTIIQPNVDPSTQTEQIILFQDDQETMEIKSMLRSTNFSTNLNSALVYLKPFQDIVALTSTFPIHGNVSSPTSEASLSKSTPIISSTISNSFLLSDYMNWFLKYGKTLFDSWKQAPDSYKYNLIGQYLLRFDSSIFELKLLFAAYLLNPKHRCAYMTQKAKNMAIEEILNVASEFMPEESDGCTIFEQWKLYLVREEPYDMIFEENRSNPLEWWMSLPCAESIRRVALRILKLKAFTSPKPETLFSQLYFYEDEAKSNITSTAFEDLAVLRYFYDYEDKVGHNVSHSSSHNHASYSNTTSNSSANTNGYFDRTQVGHLHNNNLYQLSFSSSGLEIPLEASSQLDESLSLSESCRQSFSDSFADVVVESYMSNDHPHLNIAAQPDLRDSSTLSLEDLPKYKQFIQFIDYNDLGVQIIEEPTERKKRKWTAQEILSKCQSNSQESNITNDLHTS